MAWRARKSIKLGGGTRLNLSSKGIGVSTGVKGFRVGIGSKGLTTTVSIPGTGIRKTKTTRLGSKSKAAAAVPRQNSGAGVRQQTTISEQVLTPRKEGISVSLIIAAVAGVLGLIMMNVLLIAIAAVSGLLYYRSRKPPTITKPYNSALENFKRKDYALADQQLDIVLQTDPHCWEAQFLKLQIASSLDDAAGALALYGLIADNPSAPAELKQQLPLGKAHLLKDQGKLSEAVRELQSIVSPVNVAPSLLLAECFIEMEQYETAIELLKAMPLSRKRTVSPEMIECKYLLGLAYLMNGDKAKAKTQLSAVCANDAEYRDVQKLLYKIT